MSGAQLLVDLKDGVMRLTLNRPNAANALNTLMINRLEEALAEAVADQTVVAVVLGSAADSVFSAGMDVKEESGSGETLQGLLRLQWAMENFPKPLVAALGGHVIGGGAEVALSADIRIGRDDTTFVFPATGYGLVQGTWHLVEIVGSSWAREIVLTGRPVSAAEALRLGLLHEVNGDPQARAMELVALLSTRSPKALTEVKRLFVTGAGRSLEERFRHESDVNEMLRRDPDTRARFQARFGGRGNTVSSGGGNDRVQEGQ